MNKESLDSKYIELANYSLNHQDPAFIHQTVVDTYAAQTADTNTKPIKITFALVGLYLCIEKGYSGKKAQLAHIDLSQKNIQLPEIYIPKLKGEIKIDDVLLAEPGINRDEKIKQWAASVWRAYKTEEPKICRYLKEARFIVRTYKQT